jgi:hypothetical protein
MPRGGSLTVTGRNEILHGIRYARITIADTGEGMDEHILSLIFEPFFTTREAGRGTGLGLTITRKIIEEHGGFVRAESTQGKGSVFSLYLPQQSEEESRETPCWEYMRCGRNTDTATKCPAYPNFGRSCWAIAGTFCEGKVQGAFAQKCEDCRTCAFYHKVEKERK